MEWLKREFYAAPLFFYLQNKKEEVRSKLEIIWRHKAKVY
jgi:hypothetical protein